MKRVRILELGRRRAPELQSLCEEYYRRCSRKLRVEERQVRDRAALERALRETGVLVALDERGRQVTSREFAELWRRWLEGPAGEVVFVIGDAEGLDEGVRARADLVLALGRMTFAHGLARLILAEQIYRALSILEGSPYHREG